MGCRGHADAQSHFRVVGRVLNRDISGQVDAGASESRVGQFAGDQQNHKVSRFSQGRDKDEASFIELHVLLVPHTMHKYSPFTASL